MRLSVLMFNQDDPKKCTAARMVKFGLARSTRRVTGGGIVLDPFAERTLLPADRGLAGSVVGVDCSWRLASRAFSQNFGSMRRRLPPLLAGNPVNYSKIGKLTTAEALAGALFVLGLKGQALGLLDKFKWGHTFYELNQNLIGEYMRARSPGDVDSVARRYGLGR